MTTTTTHHFNILTSVLDSSTNKRIVGDMRITRRTKLADKPHKYGAMDFTRVSATIATNLPENVNLIAHNQYSLSDTDKPVSTFVYEKIDTSAADSAYKRYSALPLNTMCNHCGINRDRTSIFYGIDTSTSTDVQYGSTCMEDYIKKDDLVMIKKLEELEIKSNVSDSIIPDKWFLTHAVTIVLDGIYDLKNETAESLELKLQNEYPDVVARLGHFHNRLIDGPFSIASEIRNAKQYIDICKSRAKAKETATTPIIEKPREFMPDDHPANPNVFWAKLRSGVWS